MDPDRHYELELIFNFRDLGGIPTAEGRRVKRDVVFRADGLNRLGGADLERVAELGLRAVVDLRTVREQEAHGSFPVHQHPVAFHHLPLLDELWDLDDPAVHRDPSAYLLDRYVEIVDNAGAMFRRLFELVADDDHLPLVFHCAAGKDRTGVAAAMLLDAVGVDTDRIAHDYGMSAPASQRFMEWAKRTDPEWWAELQGQPDVFRDAPPSVMVAMLDQLNERYGSLEAWRREVGIDDDLVVGVRRRLLE